MPTTPSFSLESRREPKTTYLSVSTGGIKKKYPYKALPHYRNSKEVSAYLKNSIDEDYYEDDNMGKEA